MLEDILRAGEDSAALLEQLRLLPPEELGEERATALLQAAIERKPLRRGRHPEPDYPERQAERLGRAGPVPRGGSAAD